MCYYNFNKKLYNVHFGILELSETFSLLINLFLSNLVKISNQLHVDTHQRSNCTSDFFRIYYNLRTTKYPPQYINLTEKHKKLRNIYESQCNRH